MDEEETQTTISKQPYEKKFGSTVIGIRAAARKYRLHVTTLARWVEAGYIDKVNSKLLEAHVAYCHDVYRKREKERKGKISGVKIFDDMGRPYKPKQ